VASDPGKGSTFTVLLPRLREGDQAQSPGAIATVPAGAESVLFLDDEEFLVQSGKAILESLGYTVTAVQSSMEALKLFQQTPAAFDLVITDQTMPRMTGYELAQRLMEIRKDVPVILCTGYSESVSEEKARALGIKGFIMKPVRKRELAEMIRKVLEGK
jgi:CheY-like chemotaxis protein